MRNPAVLAGLALAASVLTGCGGDGGDAGPTDTETYCKQLKTDEKYFTAFSGGDADPSKLGEAIDRIHGLADKAPDAVVTEWDLLDSTLSEIERTLAQAGISTEDLAGLQGGDLPKDVNVAELAKLAPKLRSLNSPELQEAAETIRTHAQDECGVELRTG